MKVAPLLPSLDVASTVQAEELPHYIKAIIESATFEKAPTLRALLVFLWVHRNEPISEFYIATGALGRSSHFDARTDATVRVQISRLRQRLEKFYEGEGKDVSHRLTIPLGSHQIQAEEAAVLELPVMTPVQLETIQPYRVTNARRDWRVLPLLVACLVLASAVIALALRPKAAAPAALAKSRFWTAFFDSQKRTRVILPMPAFFSFTMSGPSSDDSLMVRDTTINEFADGDESAVIRNLRKSYGSPTLAQAYTVTSDTFAAVDLVRYLDRHGYDTAVLSTADSPLTALERENVIALGTWGTLSPLQSYLDQLTMHLTRHEKNVTVSKPKAGEPASFDGYTLSDMRSVWPSVIALLPGRGDDTKLLLVASRQTSAAFQFLTTASGQDLLDRAWKKAGSPEYFELLLASELNGEKLVRFWPVLLRPFDKAAAR